MKRLRQLAILGLLLLLICMLAACQCPPCPTLTPAATCAPTATVQPTATPVPILWDPRLSDLGLTVERVPDTKFRLIAAWCTINGSWDDVPAWARQWQWDGGGGDHHAYGRAEMIAGAPITDKMFMLSWPDGADGRTPEMDNWANIPLAGQNWNPANGPGPYTWECLKGDRLHGLGMPLNHHYSFFGVWKAID